MVVELLTRPQPVSIPMVVLALLVPFYISSDPEYNCFPSLHVAQSFLSALTCYRVHRGVGVAAGLWASFIGVATMWIVLDPQGRLSY